MTQAYLVRSASAHVQRSLAAFVCRNCQVSVHRHRAVRLFGTKAATERLSLRICDLLDVPSGGLRGVSKVSIETPFG